MELKQQLIEDMKNAMKNKEKTKLLAIRMILNDVKNAEIAQKIENLSEKDILAVIQKLVKQYTESLEAFKKTDNATKINELEVSLNVLKDYLPAQMNIDEIRTIVDAVISEHSFQGKGDTGKAMKEVMAKLKGRADGKIVNQIVAEKLAF